MWPVVEQSSSDADWLGNLINWLIFQIAGGICFYIGLLLVLLGDPTWFYTFMLDLKLLPPGVTSYSYVFDA